MALDNEIRSGEYDNFEIAQEDADKEVKTLDDQKGIIQTDYQLPNTMKKENFRRTKKRY